ncbi:MAG: S41 family peptidase [Candidatus Baltobacteraceae bacterium]
MPPKLRALVAALIVAACALAGALYIGYASGIHAAAHTADLGNNSVASIDLRSLLEPQNGNERLVDIAFRQVENSYYKPVNAQTLLTGEHTGLLAYLSHDRKIKSPTLPKLSATGDQTQDEQRLDAQVAYAQTQYGGAIGSDAHVELVQAALTGMLSSLGDPYTVYLSPKEISGLNESLSGGNFGGIGVYLYELKDKSVLLQPIDGLPASVAGVKTGDILVRIDGKPTKGLSLDRVAQLIRGEQGTTVHVQTHPLRAKTLHIFAIVRQIIHVPTVKAKMEDGFDYIRLSDFGETSAAEIKKALLSGRAKNAKGYILDLRDNGGGLVDAAVKISSFFIPQGVIVSTISRDGSKDEQEANGEHIPGLSPLVILVNKYTASASEITSGAIQDYKLGTLLGTKTFGKGVVQNIYPMPDNSALKITTARYVTPLGRDIQHKGIEPDIVVPQNAEDPGLIDTPKDKQLAAAKAHLRAQLAGH